MTPLFTGICTALPTPFLKNREIDFPALEKLINRQIESGINALCILGTTGEASTLSFEEKIAIVKFSLSVVNGRLPIIFGIGGNNPPEILKLGREIKSLCTKTPSKITTHPPVFPPIGVLLSAPYYNKCTQSGAIRHFNTVANALKLPLIIYNIPARTGMNLTPETTAEIARNRFICGVKECGGNIEQLSEIVRLCPNTAVYSGDDPQSLPAYSVGARGCISVAANIRPRETLQIYRTLDPQLFLSQLPFYRSLFQSVNPIPLKAMLAKLGLCHNILRPPLTPMTLDTKR